MSLARLIHRMGRNSRPGFGVSPSSSTLVRYALDPAHGRLSGSICCSHTGWEMCRVTTNMLNLFWSSTAFIKVISRRRFRNSTNPVIRITY